MVKKITQSLYHRFPRFSLVGNFLVLGLVLFSAKTLSQSFSGLEISTREGLPSNMVYGCLQEKSGALWFCSEMGVSRFNGENFQHFSIPQGLTDSDVLKIFQDKRERIWLLLSNGEINLIDKGKVFNRSNLAILNKLVCTSYFNGVLEDPEGNLWFSTYSNGIFKLSPSEKVTWLRPLSDLPASILEPGILVGADKQIRIGSNSGVVNLSKNPVLLEVPAPEQIGQMDYFTQTRAGTFVLAYHKGIWICRKGQRQFTPIPENRFHFPRGVNEIREDPEGDVWISTMDGLFQVENGDFENGKITKWLDKQAIGSVFFDRQGNFWILSLENGLLLVQDKKVVCLGLAEGLPNRPICKLIHYQNRIWFGNNRGEIGYLEDNRFRLLEKSLEGIRRFGRGAVRDFRIDPMDGSLWVLTENGLIRLQNGAISGVIGGGFTSFAFDSNQNLVMGTAQKAFLVPVTDAKKWMAANHNRIRKGGNPTPPGNGTPDFYFPTTLSILPVCRVNAIETDPAGTLWFATNKGLFSFQKGRSFHHKENNPLLALPFQNLVVLKENEVLASSNGFGLVCYNGNVAEFSPFPKEDIASAYFKNLKKLSGDSVLAATPKGLLLFHRQRNEARFRHQRWGSNQGINPEDVFAVEVLGKSIITASKLGLTLYPAFPSSRRSTIEKPRLLDLKVGPERIRDFGSGIAVPPEPNRLIRASFENVDFQNLGKTTYRYRLNPNQSWQETRQSEISTPLPESGHFRLEIQYRTASIGNWKPLIPPLSISIVFPWYKKPLVWILAIGCLTILALGLVYRDSLFSGASFLRKTRPSELGPTPWLRFYFPIFQNGLDALSDFLSEDNSEAGLVLLSRIRFMGNFISARLQAENEWLLKDELRMLNLFLETEQTHSTPNSEISFRSELESKTEESPFPPFLLVLLAFAGTRFRSGKGLQKTSLTAVQIGLVLQFTLELDPEVEETDWAPELLSKYQSLTHILKELTEEYNKRNAVKPEVFYPHIKENRLTSSRFQIWIPVK